ncbi:NnrU family protein [Devosia submarina]|uniref:NnrU family protein n=1 Tax=Devosia submarina TaxID=1173082 RepID=UPI0013003548|nr:NnrU family protein [Devosia submarina]
MLITVLGAFVLSHLVPALPSVRARLIGRFGRRSYFTLYGIVSLFLLLALIHAAATAPYVELWPATELGLAVPRLVMPLAVVLAVAGLLAPNPLSMSLNRGTFDPLRPGIVAVVRHPVLWALLIWSLAHLAANGDVGHIVLFGTFAAMSALSMMSLDRRRRAKLGRPEWNRLAVRAPELPLLPALGAGWRPAFSLRILLHVLLGLAIYGMLALTHVWFAGVPAYS